MKLTIRQQRERVRVGSYYTNGREVRQVLSVGRITLEAEDAVTGEVSSHGIGGFRRNWWLVASRAANSQSEPKP